MIELSGDGSIIFYASGGLESGMNWQLSESRSIFSFSREGEGLGSIE
jgi:hypothetical protein